MSDRALDVDQDVPVETDLDDIDAYIATFDERERQELAAAEAAIDIAIFLHRVRERRGLSQRAAAELAGLQQQAVSRFERPAANPQLGTIQEYLGALGYGLAIQAIDLATGEPAATLVLLPKLPRHPRRRARSAGQRRRQLRERSDRAVAV